MSTFKPGDEVWVITTKTRSTMCPHCEQEWLRPFCIPCNEPRYIAKPVQPDDDSFPLYFLSDSPAGRIAEVKHEAYIFHTREEMLAAYERIPKDERHE